MSARVTPYLTFGGNAREAMQFYQSIFGGTLEITTFGDLHRAEDDRQQNLVAHSMLRGSTGVTLMASDSPTVVAATKERTNGSFSVALGGDEAELTDHWVRLSEGATVAVPFAKSAWGALHGQCVDRFGTSWLVNVTSSTSP